MMKHPETEHEVDGDDHEDCLEIAEDLLKDLEEKEYPEHLITLTKGLIGELQEYEDDGEQGEKTDYEDDGKKSDENPDEEMNDDGMDEVDDFAKDEVEKKMGKPMLEIKVGAKKK